MNASQKPSITWSYSSLDLFKQCPKKYYHLRVKKDVVDPPTEAKDYGTDVHLVAEEFVRDKKPIPKKYDYMSKALEVLSNFEGTHLCEQKLGLTEDLEPCDFGAENVWWRGIVDLLIIQDDKAYMVDYKTGKNAKYAKKDQLEIFSLAVFKHYPQIKKVKAGLLYVVANEFIKQDYLQENADIYWQRWIRDANRLEESVIHNVWNAKPNFTCRGWCPVVNCTHWEPNRK